MAEGLKRMTSAQLNNLAMWGLQDIIDEYCDVLYDVENYDVQVKVSRGSDSWSTTSSTAEMVVPRCRPCHTSLLRLKQDCPESPLVIQTTPLSASFKCPSQSQRIVQGHQGYSLQRSLARIVKPAAMASSNSNEMLNSITSAFAYTGMYFLVCPACCPFSLIVW